MSTAADLITGALLNINSYSPGEALSSQDGTTGLNSLNDLLDSLTNDQAFVYTQQETIYPWIPGKYQYSVGNPVGGTFSGALTSGSPTITGTIPANLIANGDLSDVYAAIPSGTVVGTFTGTTVSMVDSAGNPVNALSNQALDTITYTVPGDIKMGRPLRFHDGFTRSSTSSNANNDFIFQIVSFERYKEELLKNIQGPWPYIAAYQPTFPLGTLYIYPSPGSAYTAHIFTDLIISGYATTSTTYALPQGYNRAIKKLLALELAPIYGKTPSPQLLQQAKDAIDLLKGTNATPVVALRYDSAISRSQVTDAGWILRGGFT